MTPKVKTSHFVLYQFTRPVLYICLCFRSVLEDYDILLRFWVLTFSICQNYVYRAWDIIFHTFLFPNLICIKIKMAAVFFFSIFKSVIFFINLIVQIANKYDIEETFLVNGYYMYDANWIIDSLINLTLLSPTRKYRILSDTFTFGNALVLLIVRGVHSKPDPPKLPLYHM